MKFATVRDIPIGWRIAALPAIPAAVFLFFVAAFIHSSANTYTINNAVSERLSFAHDVGDLIHNVQVERGLSALYLASPTEEHKRKLVDQRLSVDRRHQHLLEELRQVLKDTPDDKSTSSAVAYLEKPDLLDAIRSKVDKREFSFAMELAAYTKIVLRLSDYLGALTEVVDQQEISSHLRSIYQLERIQDLIGRKRSLGAIALESGWSTDRAIEFDELTRVITELADIFNRTAAPEHRPEIMEIMNSEKMGDLASAETVMHLYTDPDGYFATVSETLTALAAVEDKMSHEVALLAQSRADDARYKVIEAAVFTLIVLLVGGALVVFVTRDLVGGILRINHAMNAIRQNELEVAVPDSSRKDELGSMAKSLETFRQTAKEKAIADAEIKLTLEKLNLSIDQREASDKALADARKEQVRLMQEELGGGLAELRSGNFQHRITGVFPEEYEWLKREFNTTMENLGTMSEMISQNALALEMSTSELSHAANELAKRSEFQAARVKESSDTLNLMAEEMIQSARESESVKIVTEQMNEEGARGSLIVSDAIIAMQEINHSSDRIADITQKIETIARQTNLLAINASIEAASAGAAGSGFAVVAQEVRGLAAKTAEAVSDIAALAAASRQQTANGVTLVNQAGAALETVLGKMTEVAGAITSMASLSERHSITVTHVRGEVANLGDIAQRNADLAESALAAMLHLSKQSQKLTEAVSSFDKDGVMSEDNLLSAFKLSA